MNKLGRNEEVYGSVPTIQLHLLQISVSVCITLFLYEIRSFALFIGVSPVPYKLYVTRNYYPVKDYINNIIMIEENMYA